MKPTPGLGRLQNETYLNPRYNNSLYLTAWTGKCQHGVINNYTKIAVLVSRLDKTIDKRTRNLTFLARGVKKISLHLVTLRAYYFQPWRCTVNCYGVQITLLGWHDRCCQNHIFLSNKWVVKTKTCILKTYLLKRENSTKSRERKLVRRNNEEFLRTDITILWPE